MGAWCGYLDKSGINCEEMIIATHLVLIGKSGWLSLPEKARQRTGGPWERLNS
jgi:hypothetical protein